MLTNSCVCILIKKSIALFKNSHWGLKYCSLFIPKHASYRIAITRICNSKYWNIHYTLHVFCKHIAQCHPLKGVIFDKIVICRECFISFDVKTCVYYVSVAGGAEIFDFNQNRCELMRKLIFTRNRIKGKITSKMKHHFHPLIKEILLNDMQTHTLPRIHKSWKGFSISSASIIFSVISIVCLL